MKFSQSSFNDTGVSYSIAVFSSKFCLVLNNHNPLDSPGHDTHASPHSLALLFCLLFVLLEDLSGRILHYLCRHFPHYSHHSNLDFYDLHK